MCRNISIIVLLYAVIVYFLFSSTSIVCPLDKDVTREVFATARPVKFGVRYIFSYCNGRFRETIYPSTGFTDEMRDEWIKSHPTQIFHNTIWGWYSNINNNRFAISAMVLVPITILIFTSIAILAENRRIR
jgi:hypothetical protein